MLSAATPTPSRDARIPGLDGLRAIAFGLVFLAHCRMDTLVPGGLGVTLFFVLSGFLITTLLRQEFVRHGDLSFRHFYWRRALRILPPFYLTLLVVVALHVISSQPSAIRASMVAAYAGFVGNYVAIATDFAGSPAGAGVLWSLAIEEHFYLLYPPLALWLLRKDDATFTTRLLLLLALAVLLWRLVLWFGLDVGADYLYYATDSRLDSLLLGSLLALVKNPWLDPVPARAPGWERLLLVGCLGVLIASLVWRDASFRATLRYSLQAAALLPLFWLVIARNRERGFRWLDHPLLVEIGSLSYSLYLIHHAVIEALEYRMPGLPLPALVVLSGALSWAYAGLMRRFVERPLSRLRPRR